jgi:hypothetical protein
MNVKVQSKAAQRPVGFTDRSCGFAGKHAREQGWRIIEVKRTITFKTKNILNGKHNTVPAFAADSIAPFKA